MKVKRVGGANDEKPARRGGVEARCSRHGCYLLRPATDEGGLDWTGRVEAVLALVLGVTL